MKLMALDGIVLEHRDLQVEAGDEGVRLHCVQAGEGPLVVLLHGFPDFWYGWRRQIPALVHAGFRVVVPDQRGYATSSKPAGVSAYGVRTLAQDVDQLIHALGEESAHLVGHDWGAGVAWATAMAHPERVRRLAILNGPHPKRFIEALKNPVQLAKSYYMFLFQLPWLPEQILGADRFSMLVRALRDEPTREGAVTEADLALYREAWSQPGALTTMIHWYRAMIRPHAAVRMAPIEVETLVLWGEGDIHLEPSLAAPPSEMVPHARVDMIPGASHWVQLDAAEQVNAALIAFLREASA